MRIMKIALVNKTFSRSHGGAERFSVNLATALHAEGHDVHVYAHRAEDLPEGIAVHHVPMARKPAFWRIVSFSRNVRSMLAREDFDIVYGLTQIYPQDLHRMGGGIHRHWMRTRYPFAPQRWLNYLVNPAHLANIWLEGRIYRPGNYRRIVTNSRLCQGHARQYYGVPAERLAVIYNGVGHDTFNPEGVAAHRAPVRQELGIGDDDVALLFVASNWKRKGLDVILRAVAALGRKGSALRVVVVGRGKPAPFRKLADSLGLADRVHFAGASDRVERFYGAGDLLVLPTLYDPFSNVCLEGMACGLPVITSAANGAAEIIRDGENGYVQQDPRSALELAHFLELCLDTERRQRMAHAARETSRDFTPERNMRETLNLCRQVLAEKGP